jgi:hypothetical protein
MIIQNTLFLLAATFLGLKSPTEGTNLSQGAVLGDQIGIIIGNIVGDLFVIAAFVATIFVIYSGIMYITSMGDSGKMATAKDGLARALGGFFITLVANVIVNTVLQATGSSAGPGSTDNLTNLINDSLFLVGILGVIMTIVSGILYMISAGDTGKVAKARNALITSLVGTAVAFLGSLFMSIVTSAKPAGDTLQDVAASVVPILMWVAGVAAVACIVTGGIMYATAAGDESKTVRARHFIQYAIVGLVIALASWSLQTFVLKAVGG